MTDETDHEAATARRTAAPARPPGGATPAAAADGETSFGDAEAAAAAEPDDAPRRRSRGRPERDEYLALAQRTQADFENFRKRAARENAAAADRGMAQARQGAAARARPPRARAAGGRGARRRERRQGLPRWSQDELLGALERVGIQAFSPKGEPFDPNEHEAMARSPSEGAESGTVDRGLPAGYRINGAVLRPARVVVAA